MSTTIDSPGRIGPEPLSCTEATCGPCEAIAGVGIMPASMNAWAIAACRSSLVTPSRRSAARTASIASSQARWARRMPAICSGVFARRRAVEPGAVGAHGDAGGDHRLGRLEREPARHDGIGDAHRLARAHDRDLVDRVLVRHALRRQLVEPELLQADRLEVG